MRKFVMVAALAIACFSMAACRNDVSTQSFEVTTGVASGTTTRMETLTSERYYIDQKEHDVLPRLEGIINSGNNNITAVHTSYENGYLVSADIMYDSSTEPGAGRHLRVIHVRSDQYYYDRRMAEVQPRLSSIVNGGQYDIVKVNSVYDQGYLIAAEVYYRVP